MGEIERLTDNLKGIYVAYVYKLVNGVKSDIQLLYIRFAGNESLESYFVEHDKCDLRLWKCFFCGADKEIDSSKLADISATLICCIHSPVNYIGKREYIGNEMIEVKCSGEYNFLKG